MARSKSKKAAPGSVADTVAMLAVWARRAPRGFAHVEYHSEYARAEADRRLREVLLREQVPYHPVDLPIRVTASQAGRFLQEHLETIESGAVSITGFATAVSEEDRRDFLAILSVRREVLAELGLCQIWWLTPNFRDALMHIAPDLDSWFMIRLHLEEEFHPPAGMRLLPDPAHPPWPKYPIDEALRQATGLVERFQRAKAIPAPPSELVETAAAVADVIVAVGAPNLTRGLADELVSGLADSCRGSLTDCLSTVRNLNRVARLLVAHGRIRDAMPLLDRAWAKVEQGKGRDHPDAARDLLDLADLYLDINRPDRAELLYRRALAIAERAHRPWHLNVTQGVKSLADLLLRTGRLGEAESLCRRALEIDERNLGPDHPDTAADLCNLAVLLLTTGRLAEAEPLFRRALAMNERWLGSDDPSVAFDLNNLAALLRAKNQHEEAEALLRRALTIDEQRLGPDHPAVARDLVNLAPLLEAGCRLAEAEALFRRALAIDERIYGPGHPSVVRDRNLLASLLRQGRSANGGPDERAALT